MKVKIRYSVQFEINFNTLSKLLDVVIENDFFFQFSK